MTPAWLMMINFDYIDETWIDALTPPEKRGHYLVGQKTTDHKKYRWVRYWNGEDWGDIRAEKYGDVYCYTTMPTLP
jgi:hypothetical protein